ncbi:MAG: hypothetical protein WC346_17335 [Methanogenium sp.]|jgi:hypothetical protein
MRRYVIKNRFNKYVCSTDYTVDLHGADVFDLREVAQEEINAWEDKAIDQFERVVEIEEDENGERVEVGENE